MKTIGIAFIIFVIVVFCTDSNASTKPLYNNSFCSGYAANMAKIYKMKYYYNMQQYFDSKISSGEIENDSIASEYYQGGSDSVLNNVAISHNLNEHCEDLFKRKL